MVAGTRIIAAAEAVAVASNEAVASTERLKVIVDPEDGNLLNKAIALTEQGHRVALVNAASAYHPGGGFRTGGRHAFEEALCVRSTIWLSLQQAFYQAQSKRRSNEGRFPQEEDGDTWIGYIPEDGVVLSPRVEVFRQGTAEGYGFRHARPTELTGVVSVAMPNCNRDVRDAPLDKPSSLAKYHRVLRQKLSAALGAAASLGATALVVPAIGCGVFHNDPQEVGAALGEVLAIPQLRGQLREVLIAGPERMGEATRAALIA